LGATNRFEPLRRTYKTDTATNAESSQELADIYENWADDYDRRILSYGYSTPRGCGRVLWPLREARRRASTRRRGGQRPDGRSLRAAQLWGTGRHRHIPRNGSMNVLERLFKGVKTVNESGWGFPKGVKQTNST